MPLSSLPQVRRLTPARVKVLRARLWDFETLGYTDPRAGMKELVAKVTVSEFLTGKKTGFVADFDFAMREEKFTRIMEGGYKNVGPEYNGSPAKSGR
jgi:hypothetical protein